MADLKRVNGNDVSWGSCVLWVEDVPFYGFTDVSFGDRRAREKGYGMGRDHAPQRRSAGKYEPQPVTLTGYKRSVKELRTYLQSLATQRGLSSYGDIECLIVVQYIENDFSSVVELQDCAWVEAKETLSEGPELLKEEIEFDCMRVVRDDTALFRS